jgi:hypothetical protein
MKEGRGRTDGRTNKAKRKSVAAGRFLRRPLEPFLD